MLTKNRNFRLDKGKIFFLYNYYVSKKIGIDLFFFLRKNKIITYNNKNIEFLWIFDIISKEDLLVNLISNNLKKGWIFNQLFTLDKAILIYSSYELIFKNRSYLFKMIISQVINFTKVYSDEDSYKFINGILDSIKYFSFFHSRL